MMMMMMIISCLNTWWILGGISDVNLVFERGISAVMNDPVQDKRHSPSTPSHEPREWDLMVSVTRSNAWYDGKRERERQGLDYIGRAIRLLHTYTRTTGEQQRDDRVRRLDVWELAPALAYGFPHGITHSPHPQQKGFKGLQKICV